MYIVDSNFFIQAHRGSYPIDVVPGFWSKVKQLSNEGKIISLDKVKNEIFNKNDNLEVWCKDNLPSDFFKNSSNIIPYYAQVAEWAVSRSNHYMPNALTEFLDADEADAFIIAYALSIPNTIIVTHETSEPNRKNKVKIPEPCNSFNIEYCNTIDMFRRLGETF